MFCDSAIKTNKASILELVKWTKNLIKIVNIKLYVYCINLVDRSTKFKFMIYILVRFDIAFDKKQILVSSFSLLNYD